MTLKNVAILMAVVVVATAGITRYYFPQISTKTVVEEREVVKTDVRTVTRLVERPDGTKESVTETVDKSVSNATNKSTATAYKRSEWLVGATAATKFDDQIAYGAVVSKRVIGPFWLGLSANTDKVVGIQLQMEF